MDNQTIAFKSGTTTMDTKDMYLCDNFMQFKTAIDDFEYTKWLDPAGVPCYVHDV